MGLNRPDAGEVRFRGEPLGYGRAALREHRRRAQMIFQDPTGAAERAPDALRGCG